MNSRRSIDDYFLFYNFNTDGHNEKSNAQTRSKSTPKREASESQKAGLKKARTAATRSRRMKQYQGLVEKVSQLERELFWQ